MKIRNWFAALMLLCLASFGNAQQTPKEKPETARPGEGFVLLMLPRVRKELKLTEEQIAKIDAIQKSLAQPEETASSEPADPAAKKPAPEENEAKADALREKTLKETLTEKQQKRLHQIMLQARGPALFLRPETVKALEITDEQKGRLRAVLNTYLTDRRKPSPEGETPKERSARLRQLRIHTEEEMALLLSAKQRVQWQEIVGERFEITAR